MAGTEQSGAEGTRPPAGAESTRSGAGAQAPRAQAPGGAQPAARRPDASRNRLGWIAVTVAGALTAWRVVYAITAPSVANVDVYESVDLLLTLVLAVGAVVLGIVALSQRATPRWPAVAALAVGTYAFVLGVASWIGRLMY